MLHATCFWQPAATLKSSFEKDMPEKQYQKSKPLSICHCAVLFCNTRRKEIKVVLSFREEEFNWLLKGTAGVSLASAALCVVENCYCFTWEQLQYAISSVISRVVTDSVMSLLWESGCVCGGHYSLTVLFPYICTNSPWRQVGSNYY